LRADLGEGWIAQLVEDDEVETSEEVGEPEVMLVQDRVARETELAQKKGASRAGRRHAEMPDKLRRPFVAKLTGGVLPTQAGGS
jgi:hypothetical protein